MHIQIISDLHRTHWVNALARGSTMDPFPFDASCINEQANMVLLVGDLDNDIDKVTELVTTLALAHPDKTFLAIPGNHEFYGKNVHTTLSEYNATTNILPPNAHLAARQVIVHEGIRYILCILWSNILPSVRVYVEKKINDFTHIYRNNNNDPLLAKGYNTLHQDDLKWLKTNLAIPYDGRTVVVTHHAPSWKSVPLSYIGNKCNSVFVSDLDGLIEEYKPVLWVHGHTHTPMDYNIGNTRIVCNPLGYPHETNGRYNVLDFCIEL
jgi:predicted MPP superfamily phosphohydrolase